MNVVVYTALEFERASRRAAGNRSSIYTCPPLSERHLKTLPESLEAADLIFFNLHGLPNGAAWFGNQSAHPVAIRAATLATMNLAKAVVFVENCYTGDDYSPMRDALQAAKPVMIIAGEGPNYGGSRGLRGADWLFILLKFAMQISPNPDIWIMVIGVGKLIMTYIPTFAAEDTSKFKIWDRRRGYKLCLT